LKHARVDNRVPRPRQRSTPGGTPLPRLDGRTVSARRYRDLVIAFEAEVGGPLSESERAMIKQAAAMTLQAEQLQTDLILGNPIDNDLLVRLSGTAKRILSSISGKAGERRPAGPDLQSYLASRAAQPAADDADAVNDEVAAES